jgi:hypothetical protein
MARLGTSRACVGNVLNFFYIPGGFMVRRLGLVIVGLGMLFYAWRLYAVPLPADAPERTAALYKYLGQEGQAAAGAILGLIFVVVGLILVRNAIRQLRRR